MEIFTTLLGYVQTGIVFLLIITVLVAVHELGHYLFARAYGMHVNAFAVMMGGLRSTDLDPYLPKKLLPRRWLYVSAALSVGLMIFGSAAELTAVTVLGAALVGVVIPLWVIRRLEILYHQPLGALLKSFVVCQIIGAVVIGLATRFQGVALLEILGVMTAASYIAVLVAYYRPVSGKAEDAEMGQGRIEIDEPESGQRQEIAVLFKPLWAKKDRHGTEFSLLVLPLGGFAAIKGMHPKPDGSEVNVPQGFYSKSPGKRFWVLFAGPLFSILFGVLCIVGLYTTVGKEEANELPVIGLVDEDSVAASVGLRPGDRILAIDEQEVETWVEMTMIIRDKVDTDREPPVPVPFLLEYAREDETYAVTVIPRLTERPERVFDESGVLLGERIQARLGIGADVQYTKLGVMAATREAFEIPLRITAGLVGMIIKPSTAKDTIGGPMSIATTTSQATESGMYMVILLAGLLSISLGVLNLLPVPPLDGGQIVVAIIEMFRGGRRISIKVQEGLQTIGMLFILLLMLGATTIDLGRFFGDGANQPAVESSVEQDSAEEGGDDPQSSPD